ncbi:MAG: hemerythrin domain-containing protein [Myxococcales bacterium]|nr:hemerythrin domain-containing protein [Myxococcales bacterium]
MLTQLARHRASGLQDLVDLLGECHERIRRFVALARQAGSRHDVPADQIAQACIDVERYFTQALPLHVADEEESIDPRLRGLSPAVDEALDAATQQHREHEPELKALLRATNVVRNNPNDPTARGELATAAEALEAQFEEHLRLEERVIFPAIRELLSHETQTSIIGELRRRRLGSPPQPDPTATRTRENQS